MPSQRRCREGAARWYVLQTHPQQERLAELNLAAAGFPVFLPLATRRVFIRNMAIEQAQPLFGPYRVDERGGELPWRVGCSCMTLWRGCSSQ
jgi:hypothetical protein